MQDKSSSSTGIADHPPNGSARLAGACLIITAAATVAMAITRVAADADRDTLLESLLAEVQST